LHSTAFALLGGFYLWFKNITRGAMALDVSGKVHYQAILLMLM
jgi:hypothetical protein